ncbi:hypothetical protein ACFY94_31460 [Streptomyces griseorubiginosus]|uniref:hypothetical protein n=1 Tax=Streptomyces griseorubiginosus TaxID=67304 RepID=UPI0036E95822
MAFDNGAGREPNKVRKNPPGPAQESSLGRAGRRLGRGIGRIFDGAYDSAAGFSAEVDRFVRDLWNSLRRVVNRALGRPSSGSGGDYSSLPGDEGPGLSPEQAAHAYGGEGQPYPQAGDRSRVMSSEASQQRLSPEESALLTIAQEGARGQLAHAERTGGPGWTNPTLEHEAFENEIMRLVMSDERWKEAYEKYPERIPTVARYAANAQVRELLEGKPRIGEEPRQQRSPQRSDGLVSHTPSGEVDAFDDPAPEYGAIRLPLNREDLPWEAESVDSHAFEVAEQRRNATVSPHGDTSTYDSNTLIAQQASAHLMDAPLDDIGLSPMTPTTPDGPFRPHVLDEAGLDVLRGTPTPVSPVTPRATPSTPPRTQSVVQKAPPTMRR